VESETMSKESVEKLITVKTEIVTLLSRLTQPYRGNMEAAVKLVDEVIADLNQSEGN
jgi:hypothetical protein